MNALLIYANNLNPNLVNKFPGEKVTLDYSQSIQRSNFILDRFLHEELSNVFKNKSYQVIFIPYTLSQQNYLELTGLRVAAHIRTTEEFNHQYIPIVFVGPETPEQIARLSDLGNILFTSGIFSTSSQESDFLKKFFDRIMEEKSKITEFEHEKGIERLQLSPPANYQSHHSIDNELALLRWSEYLKCDDRIPEVKENLKAGLYFKYHRVLNPVKPSGTGNPYLISGKGKVLLIDDEAEKGWADFYRCFFQNNVNNKSIEFEALALDFKSLNQQDIIEAAMKKVEQFDADLVLLDLRLCDMDFEIDPQPAPKDLTGYKILEEIKKINKGIQVIITTASNKIWNYKSTHDLGANGYIHKRGDSDAAEDIRSIKNKVDETLKRAPFLKKIYTLIDDIKSHIQQLDKFDSDQEDSLRKNLKVNYDVSFELLEKAFLNSKYFNYCYLQLFLCIEEFLRIKTIFEYGDKCYLNSTIKVAEKKENGWLSIINNNNATPSYWSIQENSDVTHISTDFKMSCVLIFFFNQKNSNCHNWPNIRDVRNKKAAHPEKSIVSKDEILDILRFQKYIFNKENLQIPSKDGLSDSITEDDIHKLNRS